MTKRELVLDGSQEQIQSTYSTQRSRLSFCSSVLFRLFYSMNRPSSVYFLVASIMESTKTASVFPLLIPFSLLLFLYLLKNLISNPSTSSGTGRYVHWTGLKFEEIPTNCIKIGHILMLREDEQAPADILLLASSQINGSVYIDTFECFGESSWSLKTCIENTQAFFNTLDLTRLYANLEIYPDFTGNIRLRHEYRWTKLTPKNFAPRGSIIKTTNYVIAFVFSLDCPYHKKSKRYSKFETNLENFVAILIALAVLVAGVFTLCQIKFSQYYDGNVFSLINEYISFNNLIPIPLFLLLAVKGLLVSLKVQECSDLGQVDYLVTDKTGTLAEKELSLACCVIDNVTYKCSDLSSFDVLKEIGERQDTEPQFVEKHSTQEFLTLRDYLQNNHSEYNFLRSIALCNSATVYNEKTISLSSIELALLKAAGSLGCQIISKTETQCVLNINGSIELYDIIAESYYKKKYLTVVKSQGKTYLIAKAPVKSLLKSLSRYHDHERILSQDKKMNLKGLQTLLLAYRELGYSEILEIQGKVSNSKHSMLNLQFKMFKILSEYEQDLELISVLGLQDIIKKEAIDTLNKLKKTGIKVWMVSGDSSQSVISAAKTCKLWKPDTPIVNVSNLRSSLQCASTLCKMMQFFVFRDVGIDSMMQIPSLNMKKTIRIDQNNRSYLDVSNINSEKYDVSVTNKRAPFNAFEGINTVSVCRAVSVDIDKDFILDQSFNPSDLKFAVVIDAVSFRTAVKDEVCRKLLVCLLFTAKSVCFSKMFPADKADVVKLLKENLSFKPFVCAVADTSDDPMIMEADKGFKIKKDIECFEHLQKMICEKGFMEYTRKSKAVLLFFYIFFMIGTIRRVYWGFSDFSPNFLFEEVTFVLFSYVVSAIPISWIAFFAQYKMHFYALYRKGIENRKMSIKMLVLYSCLGSVHAGVILVFVLIGQSIIVNDKGLTDLDMGIPILTCCFLSFLIQCSLEVEQKTGWFYLSMVLSVLFFSLTIFSVNYFCESKGIFQDMWNSPAVIMNLILAFMVCLIFSVLFKLFIGTDKKIHKLKRIEEFSDNLLKVYRNGGIWRDNREQKNYQMNKFTLKFRSNMLEQDYETKFIQNNIAKFRICLVFVFLILVSNYGVYFTSMNFIEKLQYYISIPLILLLNILVYTRYFVLRYRQLTLISILLSIAMNVTFSILMKDPRILLSLLAQSLFYMVFNVDWVQISIISLSYTIISILAFIFLSSNSGLPILLTLYVPGYLTLSIIGYMMDRNSRLKFSLTSSLQLSIQQSDRILQFLLPSFVKKRVKEGTRYIAEEKGIITVFFCDIYNFNKICSEDSPAELLAFLHALFNKFDLVCETMGGTKIETVGKTYMLCTGLVDSEEEFSEEVLAVPHARRAVEIGIAFIDIASSFTLRDGEPLEIKIGIHSGPVTAGVVGFHKPQFSLVGDTVNTASRMCSTLQQTNAIQISNECKELINNYAGLEFCPNTVHAKGLGELDTFIVKEMQKEDKASNLLISTISYNKSFLDSSKGAIDNNNAIPPRKSKFLESLKLPMNEKEDNIKLYDCKCKESEDQRDFRVSKMEDSHTLIRLGLGITLISQLIYLIVAIFDHLMFENWSSQEQIIIKTLSVLFLSAFLIAISKKKLILSRLYPCVFLILAISLELHPIFQIIYPTGVSFELILLEVMYYVLIITHISGLNVLFAGMLCLFPVFRIFLFNYSNFLILFPFCVFNIYILITREAAQKRYFSLRSKYNRDIENTDKLLANMMPKWILRSLLKNKEVVDVLPYVTIMYADIAGFTAWSAEKSSPEVVNMLSEFFTRFDQICVDLNLYKVHTIGDCYVVMSIVNKKNRNPPQECYAVLQMALLMLKTIEEVNLSKRMNLDMRIGIHTGEVLGGVTGSTIVRYDIYGPDVFIANQLESEGRPGRVVVSDATKSILEDNFVGEVDFEVYKEIKLPNIDRVFNSYFCLLQR